jgi:hypothetical protein
VLSQSCTWRMSNALHVVTGDNVSCAQLHVTRNLCGRAPEVLRQARKAMHIVLLAMYCRYVTNLSTRICIDTEIYFQSLNLSL